MLLTLNSTLVALSVLFQHFFGNSQSCLLNSTLIAKVRCRVLLSISLLCLSVLVWRVSASFLPPCVLLPFFSRSCNFLCPATDVAFMLDDLLSSGLQPVFGRVNNELAWLVSCLDRDRWKEGWTDERWTFFRFHRVPMSSSPWGEPVPCLLHAMALLGGVILLF